MLKDPGTILERIQDEKAKDIRPLPSATLISLGSSPSQEERVFLVDTCACLVDQNWAGRCEMCVHFAILIRHGLELLGYQANVEVGKARYAMAGETFEWHHAWVCTEFGDIVDGNVDSMVENPYVPEVIKPRPYWGSSDSLPSDREFHKVRDLPSSRDEIECDAREISGWKRSLEDAIARRK